MSLRSGSSGQLIVASTVTAAAAAALGVCVLLLVRRRTSSANDRLTKDEVRSIRERYFSNAVSVSYSNTDPLMIVGGRGSKLHDSSGRTFLDTRNNVCHVGHVNSNVSKAVQRQVATLNTNTRYLHPNASLLARRLANLLPDPLEVVFLVNSGSEANDLALRLARAATGSKNTIVVDGAYHGHTLACLEVSPYKYEHSAEFTLVKQREHEPVGLSNPATPGKHIWKVPSPDTFRGHHRGGLAGKEYAQYVEDACQVYKHERNEKVGAFIIEGGMSVAGVILPPPSYLERSVNAIRSAGGVYIADEVQTGFGRLGSSYWAFQHGSDVDDAGPTAVVPDIVTVGKPFGNGMPLAAVVTTRAVSNAFESMGVEYFNTFGGNPVCSAAGLAVLDSIESASLQNHARKVGAYLIDRFRRLQERVDIIGDVRGSGLFVGIELVRDHDPSSLEPAGPETSFICAALKEKYHILTSIDGPHENVLVIKPPMMFSKKDVDRFVYCFEKATEGLADLSGLGEITKTPT